jgi:Mn2+/Fe2+ NRAMP family transporter
LAVATALAFLPIIPGPDKLRYLFLPSLPHGSLVLAAAILSWMPTGIDVSVWHSFWTLEKFKIGGRQTAASNDDRARRLRTALWDMRTGYALSLGTGCMFVVMGAVHLGGRGAELKNVEFAQNLSIAYTAIFGPWMYHVFMLTAFCAMFSTSYTVIDGFSRSFTECCAILSMRCSSQQARRLTYFGFVAISSSLACVILVVFGNPVALVTAAAMVSLAAAPLLYGFNLYCTWKHVQEPELRPSLANVLIGFAGIGVMAVALGATVYAKFLSGP